MGIVITAVVTLVLWVAFGRSLQRERRRLLNALLFSSALLATIVTIWTLVASSPLGQSSAGARLLGGLVTLALLTGLALPVALLCNGAVMWRREAHSLGNSLALLAGLSLITVMTLPVIFNVLPVPLAILLASLNLFGVAGYFGMLFVSYLLYGWLYVRLGLSAPCDAVVILGARIINGRVPPLLASRLNKAIQIYRQLLDQGHAVVLVPSGGQGPDEDMAEGQAMANYLVEHNIPTEHILLEDQAATTRENILNSHRLLIAQGYGTRLALVTNDYHALRTAVQSRRLKVNADVVGSRTSWHYLPSAALREFLALVIATRWWHIVSCLAIVALVWFAGRPT